MSPPASGTGAARPGNSFGPRHGDLEPELLERAAVFLGGRDIERIDLEQGRYEERLPLDLPGVETLLQLLHDDALMGGVHVDQHEARLVLREDVDAVQLRNGIAER